ncbi:MAG: DUF5011 domain-containing protein, partial [Clostridiales Family XIII bacterium]|nr:DUF5011 domain-containing protein [Clostridiales Family XIII bacterium]
EDNEDGSIAASAISHNTPVSTSTEAAFTVTYSVTDSDYNTVTKSGVVLVGAWSVASGYAIIAHDYTIPVGDVQGVSDTDAQILAKSYARAIDARPTLPGITPGSEVANPNLGKAVPVKVKSDGGYRSKVPTVYSVSIMVDDPANPASNEVTSDINATIDAGALPVIAFTDAPLIVPQSAVSHVMDELEMKAKMQVTDAEDNPTWDASGTSHPIFKNPAGNGVTGQPYGTSYKIRQGGDSGSQVSYIDTRNIGVYKVTYTTIDSHGNKVEMSRSIVVTDGRYIVDKANDIIIGARDFVIAQEDVDGSESQAKGRSYAEAFNIIGDQLPVSWAASPANYAAKAPVGEYSFTWRVAGHNRSKTIKGTVTGATVVDPGTKDSQYALIASDFTRTTAQARAMLGSGNIADALIQAAGARVIKLVDTAPNAQVGVVRSGDAATGPFSDTPNAYPVRFGVVGRDINELKAIVVGTVAEGSAPALNVLTPVEIWTGAAAQRPATAILPSQWPADGMYGVSATDAEDGDPANGHDITHKVTGAAIIGPVDLNKTGIYKVAYSVTDSDGNRVYKRRTVVVNDGTYAVGKSRVLEARSFEVPSNRVVTDPALKDAQIKGLSGVVLYDGATGDIIDDTVVRNDGGYTDTVADYNIVMGGRDPQEPNGWVQKAIVGRVVGNTSIAGPEGPDANGYTYYVRGDDITISQSQAQTLTGDAAVLNALNAVAEKISPSGQISDAGAMVLSVTPSTGLSLGNVGTYRVDVRDLAGNATATFSIRVVGAGSAPTISAPAPIVVAHDPNASGNVSRGEIMKGVTADDAEDGDITGDIVINPNASGAELFPSIPKNGEGVYQVKFRVEDSDGNIEEITRAVVVDGGSYIYDNDYIIQARSFIIGVSKVAPTLAEPTVGGQLLAESDAKAWDTKGAAATAIVQGTGSYKAKEGDYFPVLSISGHPAVWKQIQATVVDDSITHPNNGEQYSIGANDFRINISTANALKAQYGSAAYADAFKTLADAVSYIRTGTQLAKSGSVELILSSVVNKDGSGTRFEQTNFASGNAYRFAARFRVAEEHATFVEIEVAVSNAGIPVLTVPAQKVVAIGAAFDNDTTNPSYMSGVSATDIEDGTLPVTHNGPLPLDTSTRGAFKVTYSATDSDSNAVSKQSMILVGDWIVSNGYAITANDFTKRVGQVTGTANEAMGYAQADAIDVRLTVGGQNNPNFGAHVAVTVLAMGGYASAVGDYDITYAVAAEPATSVTKKATVVTGNAPVLNVPGVKKIDKGQFFDADSTNPSYMSGVSASDVEDGDITSSITYGNVVASAVDGAYTVVYEVSDSDRNLVTKPGIVLVGPWIMGTTYAVRAYDFAKTLGQVTGTDAEMISSARAEAICIDQSSPSYGAAGTVTIVDDGGYPSKALGSFDITFGVAEDSAAQKQITATVGTGDMPMLTVPAFKQVNAGTQFGEAQYMNGVSASDKEDGDITVDIKHDTNAVNTAVEGYYAVNYWVTDSDGNTATAQTIVLVGPWAVKNGYAIRAYSFAKRIGQVLGTQSDMVSSAKVQAVCVTLGNPNYGKAVAVSVTNDGNYPIRRVGSYQITFGVSADLGATKTVTATVTGGNVPTLNVPVTRRVALGSGFSYMQGVSASDAEDGNMTSKVTYSQTVNTGSAGSYRVTYNVTDSDGNTVQKHGVVLVGSGWVIKGGYALYAKDFARKLSQIAGTKSEAMLLSGASAVWIADQSSTAFGKYVSVTVTNTGGYKKAAGSYKITFAVSAARSVKKTIKASISDDTRKAGNVTVNPPRVIVNPPPTQPVTINNTTPTPEPAVINVEPAPSPDVIVQYPTDTAITERDIPKTDEPDDKGEWHLVDLILAIASMILGFCLMAFALRRKDDEDLQNTQRGKQIRMWGVLGVALGILSLVVLLLTQQFVGAQQLIDVWAILFAAIFGVELLAVIGTSSKKRDEWDMGRNS